MIIRRKYFGIRLLKPVFLLRIGKDGYPIFYIWYVQNTDIHDGFLKIKLFGAKKTIIKQFNG